MKKNQQGIALALVALVSACSTVSDIQPTLEAQTGKRAAAMRCDDSLGAAYKPDGNTTVVGVREIKAGETVMAVDSPVPVKLANDVCLVKLLVGPGATAEKDRTARSFTEGIGIEVWLPSAGVWERTDSRLRRRWLGRWRPSLSVFDRQ